MTAIRTKIATALALGPANLGRVAGYRLGLKTGLGAVRRITGKPPRGPFFRPPSAVRDSTVPLSSWRTEAQMYGNIDFPVGLAPPQWHANPVTGQVIPDPHRPWWMIADFDPQLGDIKGIWELSRLDWIFAFAQRARGGDVAELERLNVWLEDWSLNNPPYRGPNWKCGQEASIRVMHLAMAAIILDQVDQPSAGLVSLIELHLRRIAPTIQYAVAQDNNHGTSEATALFIGGNWLARQGLAAGTNWERLGRRWLEDRTARLIAPDGGFSQYSLNYHRVALDTLCMAEVWRRKLDLPAFSPTFTRRARAATDWLYHMASPVNGDGPNYGANDGARLLPLTRTGYRDYRPTIQLAMALFFGKLGYAPGPWDENLAWLGVAAPAHRTAAPGTRLNDDTGVAILRRGDLMATLRYPRFRFRPSQADALHVDLWREGENLLRDGGTYSYNTDPRWLAYFGGGEAHNTVQFDGRDQMPRLGRFLFGDWLRTERIDPLAEDGETVSFGAGYVDFQNAHHHRLLSLADSVMTVTDTVSGFKHKAVLRWRLAPQDWTFDGDILTNGRDRLEVTSETAIVRREVVEGWESRHYGEKTLLPVLEVEVNQPATLATRYWLGK